MKLIDIIFESIYNNVVNYQETKATIPILYKNEEIGSLDYIVSINVLSEGRTWSYDSPPEREEIEIILESANVTSLINENGVELTNLKEAINRMLITKENTILQ